MKGFPNRIIAGDRLRAEAIERTRREIRNPRETWGSAELDGGFLGDLVSSSTGGIRAQAERRLEVLSTL